RDGLVRDVEPEVSLGLEHRDPQLALEHDFARGRPKLHHFCARVTSGEDVRNRLNHGVAPYSHWAGIASLTGPRFGLQPCAQWPCASRAKSRFSSSHNTPSSVRSALMPTLEGTCRRQSSRNIGVPLSGAKPSRESNADTLTAWRDNSAETRATIPGRSMPETRKRYGR